MRILHIVPTYFPAYSHGGPIFSGHNLNKALVRAGAEVTVYTTDIDGPRSLDVPKGVPVDLDGVKVWYFPAGPLRAWSYSRELAHKLRETAKDFDVIYIISVFLAASTLGARAAKAAGKPYIISPRGSLMKEPLAMKSALKKKLYIAAIERKNLCDAAAVHFTVEAEEREYRNAGLPLRKGAVIPNPFEPGPAKDISRSEVRRLWNVPEDSRVIIALGRLNWKKGFDTLIPAFAKIAIEDPKAHLVIAGGDDDQYRAVIEKLIGKEGVQERVRFAGLIPAEERLSALRAADVFALPSYSENFGMAVADAMYAELPVVVTPEVGLADAVSRARAGYVVPKNADAFARSLGEALRDPDARAMGARGRALVLQEFSEDKVAEKMLALYNEVIS